MPNSFFTPTMSTEIARTLPSWRICQNICLRCKANIFARALIKIVQGKTDSASCRIPKHPNVSVPVFGFFNLSRSNSVLIFPACRKENSLHTVALCTALVAKSGSIASSKCFQIRRGAEKISKEQNTRRTLTFKYLQVPPHNTIRKIRFRIDWRGWGRCGVFGFLLTKREVEEDEEERGMPPALSTIQKVSGWPPS